MFIKRNVGETRNRARVFADPLVISIISCDRYRGSVTVKITYRLTSWISLLPRTAKISHLTKEIHLRSVRAELVLGQWEKKATRHVRDVSSVPVLSRLAPRDEYSTHPQRIRRSNQRIREFSHVK